MNHFNVTNVVPSCPESNPEFPSTTTILSLDIVLSLVFCLFIGLKNNSFQVQGMMIQVSCLSNTQWLLYFFINAVRGIINLFRFLVQYQDIQDMALAIIDLILLGLSTLFLSFALNHQYQHRSTFAPRIHTEEESLYQGKMNECEEHTLQEFFYLEWNNITEFLMGIQTPLIILYILFLLSIYIEFTIAYDERVDIVFYPLFVLFFFIQKVPLLVLTFLIIRNSNKVEGPTSSSKIILLFGVLFNFIFGIPLSIWAPAFGEGCVFAFASAFDLVQLLFILSLVLFMVFVRAEFVRVRQECSWRAQAWIATSE